ncbi:hypothetical protein [Methanobrevibacter sp.]|uniref:hypothetical protein n=1 Tax=Methanobrevibacter sp. TaxID=66852 RepID=UPI00386DE296
MEEAILEMQESLVDGLFIAFASIDEECYYSLTKSDELKFLDDKTVVIRRKSGRHSIINLNWIVDISIRRGLI